MTNPDQPDTWLTLEDIRSQLPGGKWRHNRIYEDVSIAIENGIIPSRFWDMDDDDKATIIAHHRAKNTIEAYEHFLAEKRAKRSNRHH